MTEKSLGYSKLQWENIRHLRRVRKKRAHVADGQKGGGGYWFCPGKRKELGAKEVHGTLSLVLWEVESGKS